MKEEKLLAGLIALKLQKRDLKVCLFLKVHVIVGDNKKKMNCCRFQ
jgi:hypothetical protein